MIPAQTETLAANPNATSTPSAGGSAGGGGGSGNRNGDGNSHGGGGRRQDPQNPAWVRIRTPNSGRIYFHNEGTQRTTWTLPAGSQFREYGDAGPGAGATQDDGESTRRAANDISGRPGGRLVRHQAAAAKTTKIVRKLKKKATKTPSLKPSPQQQTTQPSKDQNHRRQQPRPEPQSQSRPKSRPQPQPQPQLQPQREQLSRPRESFPSQGEAAASSSGCCRPFKVPWTIWLLWLLPTLVSITVNLYYKQVVGRWGDRVRPNVLGSSNAVFPPPWNNMTLVYDKYNDTHARGYVNTRKIGTGTDAESAAAYARMGLKFRNQASLAEAGLTCEQAFVAQRNEAEAALCAGYCHSCVLGGDTNLYPNMPFMVAGGWSCAVLVSALTLAYCRGSGVDNKRRHDLKTRDWVNLRMWLLLLLAFLVFAVMLFLIHEARIIKVPQGHAMYTFWLFFTSYFFGSSLLYWMRIDIGIIKARQPELSLGVAFLGYCIVSHITGAYYLTGIQAWPCLISMNVLWIAYPAYFLSFVRRGLELWATHRHHKKVLKKMKAAELRTLMDFGSGSGSFDPVMHAAMDAVRRKQAKQRAKALKKQAKALKKVQKKQKKWKKRARADEESGALPVGGDTAAGQKAKQIELRSMLTDSSSSSLDVHSASSVTGHTFSKSLSKEELEAELKAGFKVKSQSGSARSVREGSALQPDGRRGGDTASGKNASQKKICCGSSNTSLATHVRRSYWAVVFAGVLFCIGRYRITKVVGEVGCIARNGTATYFALGGVASFLMIITLCLLRGVRDEHHMRQELGAVGLIAVAFMMPHVGLMLHAKEATGGTGCTLSMGAWVCL